MAKKVYSIPIISTFLHVISIFIFNAHNSNTIWSLVREPFFPQDNIKESYINYISMTQEGTCRNWDLLAQQMTKYEDMVKGWSAKQLYSLIKSIKDYINGANT